MPHLYSIPLTYSPLLDEWQETSWVIPEEAEAALQAHHPCPVVTLEKVFRQRLGEGEFSLGWDWMMVVLPGRFRIGGYLAEARAGPKTNMILMDHEIMATLDLPKPEQFAPNAFFRFPRFSKLGFDVAVSMFWVARRGLLQEAGRRVGGWLERLARQLAGVPPQGTWVYLADAPDEDELASMCRDNARRFEVWARRYIGPPPITLPPGVDHLMANMLMSCAGEAQGEQQIPWLRKYLRLYSRDARAWAMIAFSYHEMKRAVPIRAFARKACRLAPGWIFPLHLKAIAEAVLGRMTEAMDLCREILAVFPLHLPSLFLLEQGLLQAGDHAGRAEVLERLCRLDDAHAGFVFELGMTYHRLNRMADAEAQFARAVELDHEHAHALNNYGYLLAQRGAHNLALIACRRAVDINPNSHNLDSLGYVHMRLGRLELARKHFMEALELEPGHIEATEHLAELEGLLNNPVAVHKHSGSEIV